MYQLNLSIRRGASIVFVLLFVAVASAAAQTSAFTYQGRFSDASVAQPTNGTYNMQFALFGSIGGADQIGSIVTVPTVAVAGGIFTVNLNFNAASFPAGVERFLEVRVFNQTANDYLPLSPRQALSSVPYSVRSLNASLADNSLRLNNLSASNYVLTTNPALTDARSPTAGSGFYIRNGLGLQTTSGFNIDGTGAANIFNAAQQFSIGGSRALSIGASAADNNLFVGFNAGNTNAANIGSSNSFVGTRAGFSNTTGGSNSFFGANAGFNNTTGGNNSFFGLGAGGNCPSAPCAILTGGNNSFFGFNTGGLNTTGFNNSFVGAFAGDTNTLGSSNLFIGVGAGGSNTIGNGNSFVGRSAGLNSIDGSNNSFIGINSGFSNTTGDSNVFVGLNAGSSNITGSNNIIIGTNANVGSNALNFASAIGSGAVVGTDNTIVIGKTATAINGRPADTVRIPGIIQVLTLGTQATATIPLCRNTDNEIARCATAGLRLAGEPGESAERVNAMQAQIEAQQKQINELKQIVCSLKSDAAVCGQ